MQTHCIRILTALCNSPVNKYEYNAIKLVKEATKEMKADRDDTGYCEIFVVIG